jgi:hypothetical protein
LASRPIRHRRHRRGRLRNPNVRLASRPGPIRETSQIRRKPST